MKVVRITLALALAVSAALAAQSGPSPEALLKAAIDREVVDRDLDGTVARYLSIVDRFASNHAVTSKALLQLGGVYERQGKPDAVAVYQRIVNDYGDSGATASAARARLAAIEQQRPVIGVQRVWDDVGLAVSPDGKYVTALNEETGDVSVHDITSGRNRNLTKNADDSWREFAEDFLVPSPDGKWIAYAWFRTGGYELRIVSREGGEPRVIVPNDGDSYFIPFGWSSDGRTVFFERAGGSVRPGSTAWSREVMAVSAAGGAARRIARFEGQRPAGAGVAHVPGGFTISPDGRLIAFNRANSPTSTEQDMFVLSVADSTSQVVAPHAADDRVLAWVPSTSTLLFQSDRSGTYGIWAVATKAGRVEGEPWLIRPDTGSISSLGFTRAGDFYYSIARPESITQIARLDASGMLVGRPTTLQGRYTEGMLQAVWSPDGSQLAYVQMTRLGIGRATTPVAQGGDSDRKLAVQKIATGEVRLFTLPMLTITNPTWVPDGKSLLVQGRHTDGTQGIYRVDVSTGSLVPVALREAVTKPPTGLLFPQVSNDGNTLYLRVDSTGIAARDLSSGRQRMLSSGPSVTGQAFGDLALSPDGHWLAWRVLTPARADGTGVYVLSTEGGEPSRLLPNPPAINWAAQPAVAWSRDSRSLFVVPIVGRRGQQAQVMQVPVDGGDPRGTGIRVTFGDQVQRISVHPDGRQLALSVQTSRRETLAMPNLAQVVTKGQPAK